MPAKLKHEDVAYMFEKEGYIILNQYAGKDYPMKYICPKGHMHQTYIGDFRKGVRCAKCRGLGKPSSKQIRDGYAKEGYKVVSELPEQPSSTTPLEVSCPKGHVYETYYQLWKNGNRCPGCRVYKGEAQTYNILVAMLDMKVSKETPIYPEGRELRTDFSFVHEGVTYYVEYDGEGHYRPIEFWGGQEGLEKQQERDNLKNKHLGNYLVRLNYTQSLDEMVERLSSWLEEHNVPHTTDNICMDEISVDVSRQIVEFYESHTLKETEEKFGVHNSLINRLYKNHYGMSKRDRKRGQPLNYDEMCEYYLTHSMAETAEKFGTLKEYITPIFKKHYGMTKKEYLRSLE